MTTFSPAQDVKSDVKDIIVTFTEEIIETYLENGECSDDINEYSQYYFHENILDRSYSPREAIEVLEQLDDFEETDHGLWQGLKDWRSELSARAAYTYGNAVGSGFAKVIKEINSDMDLDTLRNEYISVNECEECEGTQKVDGGACPECGENRSPAEIKRLLEIKILEML